MLPFLQNERRFADSVLNMSKFLLFLTLCISMTSVRCTSVSISLTLIISVWCEKHTYKCHATVYSMMIAEIWTQICYQWSNVVYSISCRFLVQHIVAMYLSGVILDSTADCVRKRKSYQWIEITIHHLSLEDSWWYFNSVVCKSLYVDIDGQNR